MPRTGGARVEGFKAWRLATAPEVREDRRLYGDARVSIGYIVAVLTCKMDPAGGPRSQEVLSKFRGAIADKADAAATVTVPFRTTRAVRTAKRGISSTMAHCTVRANDPVWVNEPSAFT